MIKASDRFIVPSQIMARQVGDEAVILDLATGTYYGLNCVGLRIWDLVASGVPLQSVCSSLLAEFDVGHSQIETDVFRLVAELSARGLLEVVR